MSFLPLIPAPLTAAVALLCAALASQASIRTGVRPESVDRGTLLIGELQCAACHSDRGLPTSATLPDWAAPKGAPVLTGDTLKTSTAWLRRWLEAPHRSKPGSSMPDLLHGLTDAQKTKTVDELTHYLVSLRRTNEPVGLRSDPARIDQGRALYHTVGCVACHAPETRPEGVTEESFRTVVAESVPLGDLAQKYPASELARLLRDPLVHRPSGRMPSMNLSPAEAGAIAVYLLRDQVAAPSVPAPKPTLIDGLAYEFFEGAANSVAQLLAMTPKSTGVSAALDLSLPHPNQNWGVRFSGFLDIPADGKYRFWIRSDDGSQLSIDGKPLLNNDGVHPAAEKNGNLTLKAGLHELEVVFFQGGGETEFRVDWAPPGEKRGPIPADRLKHGGQSVRPIGWEEFTLDPAKVAAGRQQFAALNCAACHAVTDAAGPVQPRKSKPMVQLALRTQEGCLSDLPPAKAPRYDLSSADRASLRKTLRNPSEAQKASKAGHGQVELTLAQFNCLSCHSRHEVGGPAASGRSEWFTVVGEADLGDEGRIPPHLTGVGGKLKMAALEQVLAQGTKVRPYMATRMPVFGPKVHALAAQLKRIDTPPNATPAPAITPQDAKIGWKLVGRDGLGCVSCHTFTTHGSMGIPALALDKMGERLEWEWLQRYLPNPAALRPGTRMPTFWPEGKAVNTKILNGDTSGQIRSIYAYLADGPKAEIPAGLIRGKKEIVVDDEAVIYRNFIDGAGPRAIGVGYPERANLAFDAQNLRLALLWQGSFIDMSRHSTDRGVGYEPPLGDHRIRLPDGPAFAGLPSATAPWPSAIDPGSRFLGYRLDARQQPTFRYQVAGVTIEETPQAKPGSVDMTLVRTFKFHGNPERPLTLRLAKGAIQPTGDGFKVEGGLVIQVGPGAKAAVVGDELRVTLDPNIRELRVEMTW
jgi:mono/diheme cytochrome c family protein